MISETSAAGAVGRRFDSGEGYRGLIRRRCLSTYHLLLFTFLAKRGSHLSDL